MKSREFGHAVRCCRGSGQRQDLFTVISDMRLQSAGRKALLSTGISSPDTNVHHMTSSPLSVQLSDPQLQRRLGIPESSRASQFWTSVANFLRELA